MPGQILKVTCQTCKREFEVDLEQLKKQQAILKTVTRGDKEEWRDKCPHCGHYNVITLERRPRSGG